MKANIIVLDCEYCTVSIDETNYIQDLKTTHPRINQHFRHYNDLIYIYKINNVLCFEKEPENFEDILESLANKEGYVIVKHNNQTYPNRKLIYSQPNLNQNETNIQH